MTSKLELEEKITQVTSTINKEYPELSKYITEIPFNSSGQDEITIENLKDYFNSLVDILNEYSKTHTHKKFMRN
jgi:hypothetical protein